MEPGKTQFSIVHKIRGVDLKELARANPQFGAGQTPSRVTEKASTTRKKTKARIVTPSRPKSSPRKKR